MIKNYFIHIAVFILLFFAVTFTAQAQSGFTTQPESFFIELIPTDAPGPDQNVIARIRAFSFDIDASDITWIHNGATQAQGRGIREYRFTTGELGSRETLNVIATGSGGLRRETSVSFIVADVSMLWQAETSVPFWYKGKALPSSRSVVTVSAFPELFLGGRKLSPENLVYRWSLDDDFNQLRSGAGKNSFQFNADFSSGFTHTVQLEVADAAGNVRSKKSIRIAVTSPSVLIYEKNPLSESKMDPSFGGPVSDLVFAGEEKSYIAEPFFFSLDQGRANLEYEWRLNGKRTDPSEPYNVLSLKTGPDSAGQRATIGVLVKNAANILQEVRKSFQINVF